MSHGTTESTTEKSSEAHHRHAAERGPVAIAIVTVSDTRTEQTDESGAFLRERIAADGHRLAVYRLIRDEPSEVCALLDELAAGPAGAILFNGGTGISRRDTTYDALSDRLEKSLPGFGELFRLLSYEEIGAAAMLSRATAGTYRGKIVLSIPGSKSAVRLAWEKLIAPELAHLVWELNKQAAPASPL